ncbi:hypothetical protein D8674_026159 [Pyrus ussuriensis x Pyrus communis]|uniref:Uncharacterized protein n=1 Tax=Pyrus ussuriensis x Pyrus communis TaxID=2448454 RepID=A0A5N5I621_9ROSA|nr:hypothetical protein D8674_026159 [Pyrus ussuriensis x Pyrus communis]
MAASSFAHPATLVNPERPMANAWIEALIHAQADKTSKLEVAYKSEPGGMINFERNLQEKGTRLEAFVDVEQSWTTKRETLKVRLGEVERLLVLEWSSCDANKSILQSDLDATQEEMSQIKKIEAKSFQKYEKEIAGLQQLYQEDIVQKNSHEYLDGYTGQDHHDG